MTAAGAGAIIRHRPRERANRRRKLDHLEIHNAVFADARAIDFFGMSGKVDVTLPYRQLSGSADFGGTTIEREVTGTADSRYRLSVNVHGAPRTRKKDRLLAESARFLSQPGGNPAASRARCLAAM